MWSKIEAKVILGDASESSDSEQGGKAPAASYGQSDEHTLSRADVDSPHIK